MKSQYANGQNTGPNHPITKIGRFRHHHPLFPCQLPPFQFLQFLPVQLPLKLACRSIPARPLRDANDASAVLRTSEVRAAPFTEPVTRLLLFRANCRLMLRFASEFEPNLTLPFRVKVRLLTIPGKLRVGNCRVEQKDEDDRPIDEERTAKLRLRPPIPLRMPPPPIPRKPPPPPK